MGINEFGQFYRSLYRHPGLEVQRRGFVSFQVLGKAGTRESCLTLEAFSQKVFNQNLHSWLYWCRPSVDAALDACVHRLVFTSMGFDVRPSRPWSAYSLARSFSHA